MSFELLSQTMRKYIWDRKWNELRKIQSAAIEKIIKTEDNYILASKTASGKTEAAFLPILSLYKDDNIGINTLYISPLVALINDQFERVLNLCDYMDIKVTKWHGDANRNKKLSLLKLPQGILLITPESIEALFCNRGEYLDKLFGNLKFVIIDEQHSYLNSARGIQLKSLLHRISLVTNTKTRCIGLSATIGSFEVAKKYFQGFGTTKILLDKSKKDLNVNFKFFKNDTPDLSVNLIEELFSKVEDKKALIFPNTRARVEEISVKLKKLAEKKNSHKNFFAHHSSVSKELREYAESFAKQSTREYYSVVCTSTLELGIDIGSVNIVCQVDSTYSVSSLIQRAGRAGRNENEKSNVLILCTNEWSLLQAIACVELYNLNIIEPVEEIKYPVDILFHQILSVLKQKLSISSGELVNLMLKNNAFSELDENTILELIEYMLEEKLLDKIDGEIILDLNGEFLVNNKEFYAVFETEFNLKVFCENNLIGELQSDDPNLQVSNKILLGAKVWEIVDIDFKKCRILVKPAKEGNKPRFDSGRAGVPYLIREKMLEILNTNNKFAYLGDEIQSILDDMRGKFPSVRNIEIERPVIMNNEKYFWYTFTSTKINRTINYLLLKENYDVEYLESESCFCFKSSIEELNLVGEKLSDRINNIEISLIEDVENDKFKYSKWARYLPNKMKREWLQQNFFDFCETKKFLKNVKFIYN